MDGLSVGFLGKPLKKGALKKRHLQVGVQEHRFYKLLQVKIVLEYV